MSVDIEEIREITWGQYLKAKRSAGLLKESSELYHSDAISNVIPGFDADKLEFGSYDRENYAVLFVDMRGSTKRAQKAKEVVTFLTMHVYLTALLGVVKHYHGKIIDIMGDGLMAFWGGKVAREKEGMTKAMAIQNAGLCGLDMLKVNDEVINEIIEGEKLGPEISIGVGVTYGDVVVTKIGINTFYDVKAFGDCINKASKYADQTSGSVKVSKKVKDEWPKGRGGKIKFISMDGGEAYLLTI